MSNYIEDIIQFRNNPTDIWCCKAWVSYPEPGIDTQCPTCHSVFSLGKLEIHLDAHIDEPIEKVLGWDDWSIFARTESGRLVYVILEMHNAWDDAPHGGDCWKDGKNCLGESTYTCRIDASWMLMYVMAHKDEMYWQNAEGVCNDTGNANEALGWPPEKDEAFMANSRMRYLCD